MAFHEDPFLPLHQFDQINLHYKVADAAFVESYVNAQRELERLTNDGKYPKLIEQQHQLVENMKRYYNVCEHYINNLRWDLSIARGMRTMDNQQLEDLTKKVGFMYREIKQLSASITSPNADR